MFLAIDVGNTQSTLGLFDEGGRLVRGWRMSTNATDTSDMLHSRLWGYFGKDGLDLGAVTDAGVASVVPALERAWRRCLETHLGHDPLVVSACRSYGMDIAMPNPRQVGADRIANATAAVKYYGAPAIVVDFGTATNIDVVDDEGYYIGGAIAPGLRISMDALVSRAARLSSVPLEAPAHAIGTNTVEAVQSGAVLGTAAMAEGLVARIKRELGAADATVIATGGLAPVIAGSTDVFDAVDSQLTLRGICEIYRRMH